MPFQLPTVKRVTVDTGMLEMCTIKLREVNKGRENTFILEKQRGTDTVRAY